MRKQNGYEHKYCCFAFSAYLKGVLWSLDIPQSAPQQQIKDNVNTDELFISKGNLKIQREIAREDTCTNRPSHDKRHLSLPHTDRHRYVTNYRQRSLANSQDIHLLRHLKRYFSGQHFGTRDTVA